MYQWPPFICQIIVGFINIVYILFTPIVYSCCFHVVYPYCLFMLFPCCLPLLFIHVISMLFTDNFYSCCFHIVYTNFVIHVVSILFTPIFYSCCFHIVDPYCLFMLFPYCSPDCLQKYLPRFVYTQVSQIPLLHHAQAPRQVSWRAGPHQQHVMGAVPVQWVLHQRDRGPRPATQGNDRFRG